MLNPQNFSVNADNDVNVFINIDPDDGVTLVGANIQWNVYPQQYGIVADDATAVITKNNGVGGTITVSNPDTQTLQIPLVPADTASLTGENYYHEATVLDPVRGSITIANGIMTVLGTKNR